MTVWIVAIATHEIWGSSQRKKGTRNREVCSADKTSVDPRKIKTIQMIAGIQLLTKRDTLMFKSRGTFHPIVINTSQGIANAGIARQL